MSSILGSILLKFLKEIKNHHIGLIGIGNHVCKCADKILLET